MGAAGSRLRRASHRLAIGPANNRVVQPLALPMSITAPRARVQAARGSKKRGIPQYEEEEEEEEEAEFGGRGNPRGKASRARAGAGAGAGAGSGRRVAEPEPEPEEPEEAEEEEQESARPKFTEKQVALFRDLDKAVSGRYRFGCAGLRWAPCGSRWMHATVTGNFYWLWTR
jgi:hypothetical protein